MQQLAPPKPFRTYTDLVALLAGRGMGIADPLRAERKLAQVGYYRLSGYWFPAREFVRDQNQNVVLCRATKNLFDKIPSCQIHHSMTLSVSICSIKNFVN